MLPASVRKTWDDFKVAPLPVFVEARAYIEKIIRGEVSPEDTQRMHQKAVDRMNSREGKGKTRYSQFMSAKASANVVKRRSGLLVPPKYKER